MPWAGGIFSRFNGVLSGGTIWQQDRDAGTNIQALSHDTHDQDLANGINQSVNKDGSNAFTGNADIGGNRITDVGDATAHTDAPNVGQIQDGSFIWCGTASGTNNALTFSPSPAITAYVAGQSFRGYIGGTSSDSTVTIAISGLATQACEIDGAALSASVVLETGKLYQFDHDGTAFQATRLSTSALTASAIGVTVQGYDADTLKADVADVLTAGFAVTPDNQSTITTGTYTPDEADGNMQYYVNGGAHTLAPPTNNCTLIVQCTNDGSAGAITTSGFTIVDGDSITTTNGDDFFFFIVKCNGFSTLTVKALQ